MGVSGRLNSLFGAAVFAASLFGVPAAHATDTPSAPYEKKQPAAKSFRDGFAAYIREDYAEALKIWQPMAEEGHIEAQYHLAGLYAHGKGVAKGDAQAVVWYSRAAERGNVWAQYLLGYIHATGERRPKDDVQAVAWYRRAADQGQAGAQFRLGEAFAAGRGGKGNSAEAIEWYRKAADQGIDEAKEALAKLEAAETPAATAVAGDKSEDSTSADASAEPANFLYPEQMLLHFVMNAHDPVLTDIKVRQAIMEAIASYPQYGVILGSDFQVADSLFGTTDFAFPANSDIPTSLAKVRAGFADLEFLPLPRNGIGADPSQERAILRSALSLMEGAGFERRDGRLVRDGTPLELEILGAGCSVIELGYQTTNCRLVERIGPPVVAQLNRIGIKSSLRLLDRSLFDSRRAAGSFSILLDLSNPQFSRRDLIAAARNTDSDSRLWRDALAGLPAEPMAGLADALATAADFDAVQDVTRTFDVLARANRTIVPVRTWALAEDDLKLRLDAIRAALAGAKVDQPPAPAPKLPEPKLSSFEVGLAAYKKGNDAWGDWFEYDDEDSIVDAERHYAEAFNAWQPLAEQGDASAQYYLGVLYANGDGISKDEVKALEFYRRAAEQGHEKAKEALRVAEQAARTTKASFEDGTAAYDRKDYAEALRILRPLAEQGNADAQFYLGEMHLFGDGVTEDGKLAEDWYRRAVAGGHRGAAGMLGGMYDRGEEIAENLPQAAFYYRMAADWGLVYSQYSLGNLYMLGRGVEKDLAQAAHWFRLAADQGHGIAQVQLGDWYASGEGVKRDDSQSYQWYRRAIEGGYRSAIVKTAACQMYIRASGRAGPHPEAAGFCYDGLVGGQERALKFLTELDTSVPASFRSAIQEHLRDGGFYTGKIDGSFGPATRRALETAFNSKPAQ